MSKKSHYQQAIKEATGVEYDNEARIIEEIMRDTIFHSTLDWQTSEQFDEGARQAKAVMDELGVDFFSDDAAL